MAFKQYTKCIAPSNYTPNRAAVIAGYGAVAGGTALGMVALSGRWDCWTLIAEITAAALVVGYCENWLYARLLCLGGDRDCVAVVVRVSPPNPALFDFDWDTDYSINLLLENCEFGITQQEAETSPPYGELIAPHPAVTAVGLSTPGFPPQLDDATGTRSAVLHAEFEGAGNYHLLLGAEAALGLGIAALLACIALPFPVGLVLGLLSLLALILGGLLGNNDFGSPSDVGIGEIKTNDDANGGLGAGADILYVQGTWVYDPLHEGWNEIHPIKVCTKVGTWDGDWGTQPDIILRVRRGFEVAQAEGTRANQARPEHQWRIHPDLDGCAREVIL